jgi:hypothetical protein
MQTTGQKLFRIRRDSRPIEAKTKQGFIHVEPDIHSRNFKAVAAEGPAPSDAYLVNFGKYTFTDGVVALLTEMGLRPGLPTELADLSMSNPGSRELAGCLPAVALGDQMQGGLGNLLVVFLAGDATGRALSLHWQGGGWNDSYWFLAFRT